MHKDLNRLIEWRTLLLENYKSLGLNEEEVMVILMSNFCLEQGETVVTPEIIALKMNLEFSKIDKILANLMNRGYVTLEEKNGKMYTSLLGIQDLLIKTFLLIFKRKNENKCDQKDLFSLFENEFGRPLTYIEMETIKSWLDEGYDENTIKSALNEATIARAKNVRYIDKILLDWRQQKERKSEGYSAISDKWRGNLEETIKIANLNWVEKKNHDK